MSEVKRLIKENLSKAIGASNLTTQGVDIAHCTVFQKDELNKTSREYI